MTVGDDSMFMKLLEFQDVITDGKDLYCLVLILGVSRGRRRSGRLLLCRK